MTKLRKSSKSQKDTSVRVMTEFTKRQAFKAKKAFLAALPSKGYPIPDLNEDDAVWIAWDFLPEQEESEVPLDLCYRFILYFNGTKKIARMLQLERQELKIATAWQPWAKAQASFERLIQVIITQSKNG